ncbi:OmpA family protein [Photobacterium alginatilyticum]|uniref:OmpA family protein n=1 Tax=Photobacterium alginatilyticum TaxID=1775171 RepID=UPI0040678097
MSCKKEQCYSLIPYLLSGILLTGCGNGSDAVTNSQGQQSTSPSSVVPSAKILLTELPEMRQTVYFDKDSYELDATNQRDLDAIAVRLRQHPDSFIVVVGHSDDSGNEEENIVLSYERAFSVAIYISSVFGVEEERIQIVAAGFSEKIAKGSSEADKRKNRRVEVLSPKAIVRTLSATPDPKY